MPELHVPSGFDGDETDALIRALVARAVASAPPPPSTGEVEAPGLPALPVAPVASGNPRRRPPRPGTARVLRAVAASIAAVVLALAGARALGGLGTATDDRAALPGDGLPVRYVPTSLPSGLVLAGVELPADPAAAPAPDPASRPEVAVYERDDGVLVRIAAGPTGWASGTAVSLLAAPPTTTTAPAGTAPPGTGGAATTTSPSTTPDTTASPTTAPTTTAAPTTAAPTVPATAPSTPSAPTTTIVSLPGTANLPSVLGVPGRPGIEALSVRGGLGGLEAHDPTSTTVWFPDGGELVAVDVFGLDQAGALGIVERLAPGAGGRLAPAREDALHLVATAGTGAETPPAGAPPPASVRLVYDAEGGAEGRAEGGIEGRQANRTLVVTTIRLATGTDDLLTATPGSFGRIERWGDRRVLVDDGLDGGATTLVSFVDPAGVLVTVRGPTGDAVADVVGALVPAGDGAWDRFLAEHADVVARQP